jgi:hypothetical protein
MTDDLSIQGTLAETTVPDLVRAIIRGGESGIVTIEGIERHDNIYLEAGRIVFASSSDPDLGLAEILVRSGELSIPQYEDATERVAGSKTIGSVLLERGYLKPDELTRAVERQVSWIVRRALAFRTGKYTIVFTDELPHEIVKLQISTERLMLDAVQSIEHWSLIARATVQRGLLLGQAPGADTRIYHLDLSDEEALVFSLVAEPLSVAALCERSYLPNFITCRTAWALLAANLLVEGEEGNADEQRSAAEIEMELEAEVERYNAAYQQLFALVFRKVGDHAFDFMDRVVRQLSPKCLPYLDGISLVNEGRVDYDQIYNNCVASGSSNRATLVREVLNELLTGWMVEIRAEFKGAFDSEVARIANDVN